MRELIHRLNLSDSGALEKEDLVKIVRIRDGGRSRLEMLQNSINANSRAASSTAGDNAADSREPAVEARTPASPVNTRQSTHCNSMHDSKTDARPGGGMAEVVAPPKLSDLSGYNVRRLRTILEEHNVSTQGIVEKTELVEMAYRVLVREYRFKYGLSEDANDKDTCKICFEREIDTVLLRYSGYDPIHVKLLTGAAAVVTLSSVEFVLPAYTVVQFVEKRSKRELKYIVPRDWQLEGVSLPLSLVGERKLVSTTSNLILLFCSFHALHFDLNRYFLQCSCVPLRISFFWLELRLKFGSFILLAHTCFAFSVSFAFCLYLKCSVSDIPKS